MEEELNNRKAKKKYLEDWLINLSQANEAVPYVQREIEKTDWEIKAFSNIPIEGNDVPHDDFIVIFDDEFNYLRNSLGYIPNIELSTLSSTDAITTSGSGSVYQYMSRIGDIDSPNAIDFSLQITNDYQKLQLRHNRPEEIKNLLGIFNEPNLIERFIRANDGYYKYKSGIGDETFVANEMRNFLRGLYGCLLRRAKYWENENDLDWEKIGKRLSKGSPGSTEFQEFIKQEEKYRSLYSRLSKVGKDEDKYSINNLNHVWSELLDYVYTILNLINH